MRGYGVLAGRYLKQQRRRSLLTVLGVVLSVALISALLTMGQAVKDNVLAQQIYEEGSYHIGYPQPEPGLYDKLRGHALIRQVGAVRSGAITPLDAGYKLSMNEANRDAFELLPIHLDSGRLPESPQEVIAEEWVVMRLPGKPVLGGTVTLNDPDGHSQPYKLVGILKNQKNSQLNETADAYTLMAGESAAIDAEHHAQIFAAFKDGVDINAHLDEFSKLSGKFATNNRLLALLGESPDSGMNRALRVIFSTLVGLVVLSTIAVIYNAFHISVVERIRQFGLLRTVGATPGQIRNLVFREATTLAAIGIPFGLAIGWAGLWLTLWLMMKGGFSILQMSDFRLTFHWWILIVSVGVSSAAIYLAAWFPARKASRVSPVDAVKGAGSIVRESYRKARVPSALQLLGVEGKMAANNIRRNRTKFRITTFSIILSVMLFLVFHYFTQQAFKMTIDTTENNKIAFELIRSELGGDGQSGGTAARQIKDLSAYQDQLSKIADLPGVDGVYGRYYMPQASAVVPEKFVNPEFAQKSGVQFEKLNWNGETTENVPIQLQLYDDARFSKAHSFLKAGTADPARLEKENSVLIVQTVRPMNHDEGKKEILDLTRFHVGDTLTLQLGEEAANEKTARMVKIGGILSQSPFDVAYQPNSLVIIGTKTTISGLLEAAPKENRPNGTSLIGVEVALKDGADSEPVRIALERIAADIPGGQLMNYVDMQKQSRQFAVQMKIFVYGFLVVIGLIGSLNIINTVQTNLLVRRKEIGLLQAVGMTMGQIRKMATAEGMWFGVIGSFWGLLLGGGLSYFLYVQLSGIEGIPFTFPWGGALIACIFALGVGLLSVQGPLRKMAKANLIEELREDA